RLKGRHWLAIWLIVFLAVAWIVIARYNSSLAMARELAELRTRRANLEGHRADLERRIRAAASRAVLGPRAPRLAPRPPPDSAIIPPPLSPGQEAYHVGVAANELRAPAKDAPRVARQLRLPTPEVQRVLRRRYAYFAGPYSTLDVQPLRAVRGVHLEPVLNRFYPAPDLARPVIGRVGDDGRGASGLERALDSLL